MVWFLLAFSAGLPPRQRPRSGPASGSSAEWRHVQDAGFGPQRIEAAGDLEGRAVTQVAIVAFAVVPDLPDDVVDPFLVDPQRLAQARRHAEDALDRGMAALQHLVDILRGDAVLL